VRTEVLYNVVTEFGIPMKLVRLIKLSLNETHNKVLIGKDALLPLLFNFVIRKVQEVLQLSSWFILTMLI
jgi:hypothetical protein